MGRMVVFSLSCGRGVGSWKSVLLWVQLDGLLAFFHVIMGETFIQSDRQHLQNMVVILATYTGAVHRAEFVDKLYGPLPRDTSCRPPLPRDTSWRPPLPRDTP
jgi:hypothetical protein